jgi:hypothetical protein
MAASNPQSLLAAAEQISRILEGLLARAKVRGPEVARVSGYLSLTIAELYAAVLAVLRSTAPSHAPVLVRSMHEALADLRNLVANPDYLNQMRYDNAEQMLRTCDGFMQDPDLRGMEEVQKNMGEWRAAEQRIYDELHPRGYRPFGPSKKFKQAGMAGEHATAYRFLCSFSHSDLNTLIARHAGEGYLRFAAPLPAETLQSVLGLATSIYVGAINTLPAYTTLTVDEVKRAVDAANTVWRRA